MIKELNLIIEPSEKAESELEKANKAIANLIRTGDLEKKELKYDRDFDKNCIALNSYSNEPVENVSTRRYFTMIEHYNEVVKKMKRG